MQTNEIASTLSTAYNKAADLAAIEIRKHLRPFNLRRHPLKYDYSIGLLAGDRNVYELTSRHPVVLALHEADLFINGLPEPVQQALEHHL